MSAMKLEENSGCLVDASTSGILLDLEVEQGNDWDATRERAALAENFIVVIIAKYFSLIQINY